MSSNESAPDNGVEEQPAKAKTTTRSRTAKKKTAKKTTGAKRSASDAPRLRVRQVRSDVRCHQRLRRTLKALGIRHHQDEVVVRDTPAIRGMLNKVHHLVQVRTEES